MAAPDVVFAEYDPKDRSITVFGPMVELGALEAARELGRTRRRDSRARTHERRAARTRTCADGTPCPRDDWPKLVSIEMEAGGVAAGLLNALDRPEFLMIKAVSDYGKNKHDDAVKPWRPYACDVAASFAAQIIRSGTGPTVAET